MTRRKARITFDEVTRLIKGVQSAGLPIARVRFDGEKVDVLIGHPERMGQGSHLDTNGGLLREPK